MKLVTANEMRAFDRETIETIGLPGVVLMENAGRQVAEVIAKLVDVPAARVVVLCGPGQNGGDGFVIARILHHWGAKVRVLSLVAEAKISGDALLHFRACKNSGVVVEEVTRREQIDFSFDRGHATVVVDALFGTGLQRPIEGLFADAVAAINNSGALTVAVDLPSGLDADRGVALPICVHADHTVTFAFAKRGMVTAPGFQWVGKLHVVDIGIPHSLAERVKAELLDEKWIDRVAPLEPMDHKGVRGHVLALAGSRGKTGAALLCGEAALRLGAGLVTLAVPDEIQASVDGRMPELMTIGYTACESILEGKRVLAAGPGLGGDKAAKDFLRELLSQAFARNIALVLDADALNQIAESPALLHRKPSAEQRLVLTPHPGEAARLLGVSTEAIAQDRIAAAEKLAQRFSAVVVLKGARTVVASHQGDLAVSPIACGSLGTAGAGDVLTGAIAALLSTGSSAHEAACAAVYLHGVAGEAAAQNHGRYIVAHQIIDEMAARLKTASP